jgi:hypothetical protein
MITAQPAGSDNPLSEKCANNPSKGSASPNSSVTDPFFEVMRRPVSASSKGYPNVFHEDILK